jgi:hypothetical protein
MKACAHPKPYYFTKRKNARNYLAAAQKKKKNGGRRPRWCPHVARACKARAEGEAPARITPNYFNKSKLNKQKNMEIRRNADTGSGGGDACKAANP